MIELANAINESLSDSDRIASAIGEVNKAGYNVVIALEATIGYSVREPADTVAEPEQPEQPTVKFGKDGKIEWTPQDNKFLRALKIAVDEETE